MRVDRIAGHSFIATGLGPDSIVIDLGLNEGAFALEIVKRFGCRVFGVEPMHELVSSVPPSPRITADEQAIVAAGDRAVVHINREKCATTVSALAEPAAVVVETPACTLEDFFDRQEITHADLVKIDIEGAEAEVLLNAPTPLLARIDQITVEFHDWLNPALAGITAQTHEHLEALGFERFNFSRDNSDVLFTNRAARRISAVERAWLLVRFKYLRGLLRRLGRMLER